MTEPLVIRADGVALLRGLHLHVSAIQAFADADAGYDLAHIRREYPVLDDWTDDDLTTALTYPRVGQVADVDPVRIEIDDDGEIEVCGLFGAEHVGAIVSALWQARQAVRHWEQECDRWERGQHDTD